MKGLLLENIHPAGQQLLEAEGFKVERVDTALKEEGLVARIGGGDVAGIRSKTKGTPRRLGPCSRATRLVERWPGFR